MAERQYTKFTFLPIFYKSVVIFFELYKFYNKLHKYWNSNN